MLASYKKVKHQARTYKQKMLIINKVKNDGESISNVMKQFNIKQSTISAIIKSSQTIESTIIYFAITVNLTDF
ncbi:CLUMA_CG020417, isoform A [Clunio marinus]|uniref:CLUMA_CG018985, isoform A n=1 Tax=Clunio marinus TaxID=568069 RepID=A0A1J1J4W8_9DIPT|nr:CLUMA_CG018985, isoform A [Clunio marinus]CRL07448.1 CLUMA_CG020417, isoform A [Clunio marinus]